jgi:hypothetical protein
VATYSPQFTGTGLSFALKSYFCNVRDARFKPRTAVFFIIETSIEVAFKTWFKSQASRKPSSYNSTLLTKGPPYEYTKNKKAMAKAWEVLFLQMWETPDSNPGLQFFQEGCYQ